MIAVAIISEYNPFHTGHEYQIKKIREEFGEDTAIISIMSGNFTQRGEVAVCDKAIRARAAVECGVNLVLELPFPFCMSGADYFARSGVKIANALGIVDYLSFGTESGDISILSKTAEILLSDEYESEFSRIKENKGLGYAQICEAAFKAVSGKDFSFTPNNILALEYIKALISSASHIKPHTIKRFGTPYNEEKLTSEKHQSATAIRHALANAQLSALNYLPGSVTDIFREAIQNGELPCDGERLSAAVISKFRLNTSSGTEGIHDAKDGLYNRLKSASFEANDISSLVALSETKKYTNARIRRAMWYSFFGVTSSDMNALPMYTQVLAMDTVGMKLLKAAGGTSSISILTKPSDYSHFTDEQLRQKQLSEMADTVFELTKPVPKSGKNHLKLTPFIKK